MTTRPARCAAVSRGTHGMGGRGATRLASSHSPKASSVGWCAVPMSVASTVKLCAASWSVRLPSDRKCWCCGWNQGPHSHPSGRPSSAVGVGNLDEEVTAGLEHLAGRVELGQRVTGVLEVVVHADHVVGAGQLGGEVGEEALVAGAHPAARLGLVDAVAHVEQVEGGVGPLVGRDEREVAVTAAHVEPAAGHGVSPDHAGGPRYDVSVEANSSSALRVPRPS